MKLLVLTPNPSAAASTRYRLELFFPALRKAGIEPLLRPFLDDEGFLALYRRGGAIHKLALAARAAARRVSDLADAAGATAVLIHREAALIGPPVIEWAISKLLRRPIIFDVDDAIWVPYASPTYGQLLSRLLKAPGKTHFTLAASSCVIAGNGYIADYARRFNSRIEIVPTVVDTDQFRPARSSTRDVPVLGWIGTHSSLQYLQMLIPTLQRLATRRRFVLKIVGGTLDAAGLTIDHVPWSLAREVADFQSLDIGLYPLRDDAWAVGKSGFKAIQYMACGVPVVASPVGVTCDMIRDGENGFLARSEDEWLARLSELIDSPTLRQEIGMRGRSDAVRSWSLAAHGPRFVEIVRGAMMEAA